MKQTFPKNKKKIFATGIYCIVAISRKKRRSTIKHNAFYPMKNKKTSCGCSLALIIFLQFADDVSERYGWRGIESAVSCHRFTRIKTPRARKTHGWYANEIALWLLKTRDDEMLARSLARARDARCFSTTGNKFITSFVRYLRSRRDAGVTVHGVDYSAGV